MCLFACRGHSASLIKNRCLISKGMGIGVYFCDFVSNLKEETENFTKCCGSNRSKFFFKVLQTRVISCVSL